MVIVANLWNNENIFFQWNIAFHGCLLVFVERSGVITSIPHSSRIHSCFVIDNENCRFQSFILENHIALFTGHRKWEQRYRRSEATVSIVQAFLPVGDKFWYASSIPTNGILKWLKKRKKVWDDALVVHRIQFTIFPTMVAAYHRNPISKKLICAAKINIILVRYICVINGKWHSLTSRLSTHISQ